MQKLFTRLAGTFRRSTLLFGVFVLLSSSFAVVISTVQKAAAAEFDMTFVNGVTIEVKNVTLGASDWDKIDKGVRDFFADGDGGPYNADALKLINDEINKTAQGTYKDSKMDANWDFTLDKNGCKSRLSDNADQDGFAGKLRFKELMISHPEWGCKDITGARAGVADIDVTSGVDYTFAKMYFVYESPDKIVSVDGSWGAFSKKDGLPENQFFRDSEDGKSCQDYIEVKNEGSPLDTAEMFERDVDGSENTDTDKTGNCYRYKAQELGSYDIVVGKTENRDADPNNDTDTGVGTDAAADAPDITCETQLANPLTWIACPIIEGGQATIDAFDAAITRELTIDADEYMNRDTSEVAKRFYAAWSGFRVLALGLLVIFGLVMVFGQALSLDAFDAYTVKKMVPRMAMAVIFITFSWPLMQLAIEVTNMLGVGVRSLLYAPFSDYGAVEFNAGLSSLVGAAGLFGVGSAFIGLGVFGILSLVVTALLAVIIGFAIIVFRRMLVMILVVLAPVAIVCSVLPNTEKVWKLWWDFFSKALIAFPIITLFIASGRVFAQVASSQNTGESSTIESAIAFIAYFGPYFALPTAFKLAGGAIATISGMANDKSRGVFDRLKKGRQERTAQNMQDWKSGQRLNGMLGGTAVGGGINNLGRRVGVGQKGAWGIGARGAAAMDISNRTAAGAIAQSDAGKAIADDDNTLRAATYRNQEEALRGLERDFGITDEQERMRAVRTAQASIGFGQNQAVYAAQRLVATGTGYANQEQMVRTLARAGGGNQATATSLAGYANATTKAVGRHDLAPGFSNLNSLVQREAGFADGGPVSNEEYAASTVAAARGSGDSITLMRDKTPGFRNVTDSIQTRLQQSMSVVNDAGASQEERAAALMDVKQHIAHINQLDQQRGYASVDNQMVINELSEGTRGIRDQAQAFMDAQPNADEHRADVERFTASLRVDPNDPRIAGDGGAPPPPEP